METLRPFLIFDFDGTIGDTGGLILGVADRLAADKGRGPLSPEEMDVFVSEGALAFIRSQKIRPWELPGLFSRGRKYFSEVSGKVSLVPGIKEALKALKDDGFRMGIVTSNAEETVRNIISRNDIDVFDFILSEKGIFGKGKIIKKAMKTYGISPKYAVYIGDELRDVDAARYAGLKMVAVLWGLNSAKVFSNKKVDTVVKKTEDLKGIIEGLSI